MILTEEQALQDDKSFAHHNALTELKYCGWNIPHRKSISNADIHFYAWLCRSAVALLKEQEAVVRCKDCKHRDPEDHKCDCGHDIQWQLPRADDWFCADGKRKGEQE